MLWTLHAADIAEVSEIYNFYNILSSLPVKHDTHVSTLHEERMVSSWFRLQSNAEEKLPTSSGSTNSQFFPVDPVNSFKVDYLQNPQIIHFCYKSRPWGKSVSQSPGPSHSICIRTMNLIKSVLRRIFQKRCASQDSDANADANEDERDPKFPDVSDSLLKLSLSKKRGNARLSKQIYVNGSSIYLISDQNSSWKTVRKVQQHQIEHSKYDDSPNEDPPVNVNLVSNI